MGQPGFTTIGQIDLYGVPEYDPEAHGTDVVVKSVPNVPNTDWLEVYYDGQDYTGTPTSIIDKSGNNITATANNITIDATYNSFEFTQSPKSNIIAENVTFVSGDESHSIVLWVRLKNGNANNLLFDYRVAGGTITIGAATGLYIMNSNKRLQFFHQGTDKNVDLDFEQNRWYHIVGTYGGGGGFTGSKIYIDGVDVGGVMGGVDSPLVLPTTGIITIGDFLYAGIGLGDCSIANFRLFNRALTPDEIYQLYAYQKEYFGHGDLGMTLKAGRLGIGTSEPRAMLDVRGSVKFSSGVPIVYNSGSWSSGTEIELGTLDWNNYNYHQIRCRFVGTNPVFQRYNARIRARYAGEVSFKGAGSYESFGSALKFTQNTTLQSIYTGTDGPLVAYYSDSESGGNSDAFLIIDIANKLNGRPQIQFTCTYTYGGAGQTRVIGGSHVWASTGFYETIKLYFEQFDSNNTVTGSYGDWVLIGYR